LNPPKLGLEYHMPSKPTPTFIYEIPLKRVLELNLPVDAIIQHIFEEHRLYVHPRVVPAAQLERLVSRVHSHFTSKQQKQGKGKAGSSNQENNPHQTNQPVSLRADSSKNGAHPVPRDHDEPLNQKHQLPHSIENMNLHPDAASSANSSHNFYL